MNDRDKKSLKEFGSVVLVMLVIAAAIITSAGVWNAVALKAIPSFYGWVAGVNAVVEGFGIYKLIKKLFKKEDK